MVRGCRDSLTDSENKKENWGERKELLLSHLKDAHIDVLIVTAVDKLHNARAIATDLQTSGSVVWDCFNKDTDKGLIFEYYNSVFKIFAEGEVTLKLLKPLAGAIKIMEANHE